MFSKGKKVSTILVVAILLIVSVVSFVACDDLTSDADKTITIIIGEDSITLTTEAQYLHDVLVELANKDEIVYEYEISAYGATIKALNSLINASDWSTWVGIYHTIDDVKIRDMSEWASDFKKDGVQFYTSGVGVSQLPLVDGASYLFIQN